MSWAVHAFFRYDTQNSGSPAAGLTTTASQTSASVARIPDTSFVFSGPAASGSTHGSYLASPIQLKRSVANHAPVAFPVFFVILPLDLKMKNGSSILSFLEPNI